MSIKFLDRRILNLPKDPLFAQRAADELFGRDGFEFPFSLLATEVNRRMPLTAVDALEDTLEGGLDGRGGVPFTIVRLHNVYGPRMGLSHVIPELMERAWRLPDGSSLQVFSPDHSRTFCYIDDAVAMIRRLAEADDAAGGTFNVGTERPEIRIGDLAEKIVGITGRGISIAPGADTPGSPGRRCPDMTRTRQVTGFEARVTLDDGLERTWRWYRDNIFAAREAACT